MKKVIYLIALSLIVLASCKKASTNLQYSLDSYTKGWDTSSTASYSFEFTQGSYAVYFNSQANVVYSLAPYSKINYPYTVQVDETIQLQNTAGDKQASADLIFNHVDDTDYSRVEVWTGGDYRILTKVGSVFDTIANFTAFAGVVTGNNEKNTITVVQNSTNMVLKINNSVVDTFPITLPTSDMSTGVGITTGSTTYTPATVLYNNFSLSKN